MIRTTPLALTMTTGSKIIQCNLKPQPFLNSKNQITASTAITHVLNKVWTFYSRKHHSLLKKLIMSGIYRATASHKLKQTFSIQCQMKRGSTVLYFTIITASNFRSLYTLIMSLVSKGNLTTCTEKILEFFTYFLMMKKRTATCLVCSDFQLTEKKPTNLMSNNIHL